MILLKFLKLSVYFSNKITLFGKNKRSSAIFSVKPAFAPDTVRSELRFAVLTQQSFFHTTGSLYGYLLNRLYITNNALLSPLKKYPSEYYFEFLYLYPDPKEM